MKGLLQDFRYGIRSLTHSRRFAAAAMLTLALGIGANTAVFSVIHSVLLAPWPVKDPDRVVVVAQRLANGNPNLFSTPDFLDWKQQGGLLEKMGAHVAWQFDMGGGDGQAERIAGGQVSYDLLPLLGVEPALGRWFTAPEDTAGAGNFVILSDALWKHSYNADPTVVGKTIGLNGAPYTVVGVMPTGFDFFGGKELLWTPLQLQQIGGISSSPTVHWLGAFVRLPDAISLKQARAQLDGVAARLHAADAAAYLGFGVYLQSIDDAFTSAVKPALVMLMGCVCFVLLIACANVANLFIVRGAARQRELAVRNALGASPLRIVRQLLTESVLLAAAGGALGVVFAEAALRAILSVHTPAVPRMEHVAIDTGVLAYCLTISVLVGILFGLAPAMQAVRQNVSNALRERDGSGGLGFARYRSALVVVETALACILLTGTGLALESLWSLRNVDLGFVPGSVLTFRIAAPAHLPGRQVTDFYQRVAERVRSVPGVQSAAVARNLPMGGTDPSMPIEVEGNNPTPVQGEIVTRYRAVSDDYFRVLQIPVMQGRAFDRRDTASAPAVAIVSHSLARKYWPGQSPVGKRLKPNVKGSVWCTVVGEVGDVRHWGADVDIEPTAYYPFTQIPETIRPLLESNMAIALRSGVGGADLLRSIRAAIAEVDRNVPLYDVQTMDSLVSDSGSLRRFDLSLLGAFSLLALSLAAVGVYAVIAYSVSRRTREIGVRIALGARTQDVLRLILSQGLRLAGVGGIAGLAAAFFLRRFMAGFLYGLSGNNPFVLSAVPMVIVLVALIACYLPARRATKIEPAVALRYE